jgi:stage II sporulation protein D
LLRRRGVLEETLHHELLHVVVESHAGRGLPLWFREGLVQLLGHETRPPSNGAATAADKFESAAEIERALAFPRDREELERAHAAARARVAALAKQFGRMQVVKWVGTGLPAGANQ